MISKKLAVGLSLFVAVIFLVALFGERGIVTVLRLRTEYNKIQSRIAKLQEQNLSTSQEIERVKREENYIEKSARELLGLVKEDEIVYEFNE